MDVYSIITERMIADLDKGIIPWRKPWAMAGRAVSHTTGKPYSLLNQMLLGEPGEYITYKQAVTEGGQVKKGKAKMVVFWKWLEKEDEDTKEVQKIPYLRYYNVFNINQCEGITAKYAGKMPESPAEPDVEAEKIIREYSAREKLRIENVEGDRAFYQPGLDRIVLPLMKQFAETAEYYSTAFHEMVHSTGHPLRLNRINTTANFGSDDYSKEELVAEIGSSALVYHCGLETPKSFKNNTAYIQSWLKALKDDKRMIVSASGKAEKAVEYILTGGKNDAE